MSLFSSSRKETYCFKPRHKAKIMTSNETVSQNKLTQNKKLTPDKIWHRCGFKGKYSAWSFGGNADALAKLTAEGIKTATCSALIFYTLEGKQLPQTGDFNIILDSEGYAVCITKTTNVYVTDFKDVSKEHAFKEGEGNRPLEYWRSAHKKFFTEELKTINRAFDEKMKVVCEEFEVIGL